MGKATPGSPAAPKRATRLAKQGRAAKMLSKAIEKNNGEIQQKDIADALSINSPNFISMLKSGASLIPVNRASQLAKILDMNQGEFMIAVLEQYFTKNDIEHIKSALNEDLSQAETELIKQFRRRHGKKASLDDVRIFIGVEGMKSH